MRVTGKPTTRNQTHVIFLDTSACGLVVDGFEEGEFDCLPPPKKCSNQGKTDFSRGGVVGATSGDFEQSQPTLGVVKSGDDVSLLKHGTPVCKLSRIVSCFIPDVPKAGGSRSQIPFMPYQ